MQCTLRTGLLAMAIYLATCAATSVAQEPPAEVSQPRYRMSALIMCTSCEWPVEPELQGQMAEFVNVNGFHCVEAALSLLELCRENGLYARVGGDLNEVLAAAPIKTRSVGVYHTPPIHPKAPGASGIPEDFWAQPSGERFLLGVFEDDTIEYLLIVTCDTGGERDTTLTLSRDFAAIKQMNKSTGEWLSAGVASAEGGATLSLTLPAGSGELFRVH